MEANQELKTIASKYTTGFSVCLNFKVSVKFTPFTMKKL